MKKILVTGVALVFSAFFGVAAYWYYSPYLALKEISAAARDKNAEKFNEQVDYPRLRESLKGQFSVHMAKTMGEQSNNPFAAVGALIGSALINQMVEAFVRPEMVMQIIQEGKIIANPPDASSNSSTKDAPVWTVERMDMDRMLATPQIKQPHSLGKTPRFVLQRYGFATWRLTEMRMAPPSQ